MKTTALAVLAGLALGVCATAAAAHPIDKNQKHSKRPSPITVATHNESPQGGFADNFDSYKTGSTIAGQGGWGIWYTGVGDDAVLADDHALSKPNALEDHPKSDIVQQFSIDSGVWDFSVQTFMPSDSGGEGYVIMLNTYGGQFIDSWSLQVRFSALDGVVESEWVPKDTLPLITDKWVELSAHIDLGADTLDIFYDGQPLSTGLQWTGGLGQGGNPASATIAALDLFVPDALSKGASSFYYDDVSLQPGVNACYADCDGDGVLTFFDFLCFTNAFNAGDMYADCDGDGVLTFFDFLCFTNAFNGGC